MEASNEEAAAGLMTAALSFYEAASQLNDSDTKLMVKPATLFLRTLIILP